MKAFKDWFWALVFLWIAAGLQYGLVPSLTSKWLRPDLLFSTASVVCLFTSRPAGAFFGFLSGVFAGAIGGVNIATHAVLRMFSGLCTSWIARSDLERSGLSSAVITGVASLAMQLIMLFIAPKPEIGVALLATIISATVNGVLAWPIFLLANRLLDPPRR